MRLMSSALHLAVLTLGLAFAAGAFATDETQLVDSINAFRSQAQRCAGQVSHELPPLTADPRLILPATGTTDLKQAMAQAAYPMVSVQAMQGPGLEMPHHCHEALSTTSACLPSAAGARGNAGVPEKMQLPN